MHVVCRETVLLPRPQQSRREVILTNGGEHLEEQLEQRTFHRESSARCPEGCFNHSCTSPGLMRVSARIMRKRTSSNAQPGGKSAMRRGAAPMVGAANSQVQLREKQSNLCFSLQTGRLTGIPPRSTTRSRGHVWNTPPLDTRPLAPFGIQALSSASPFYQGSTCPQHCEGGNMPQRFRTEYTDLRPI